jgi:hypothetical protein
VKAYYADRPLTVTAETAKEAFARAVEWHLVEKFTNVSISDGIESYSIDGFVSAIALEEIANTVEAAAELGTKAKVNSASGPPSQQLRAQRAHGTGIRPRAAVVSAIPSGPSHDR